MDSDLLPFSETDIQLDSSKYELDSPLSLISFNSFLFVLPHCPPLTRVKQNPSLGIMLS
jgi:hypothetical protein